jgi:sigma-B regulation protein RsbU (phosphoserine phosphatase)
MEGMAVGVDEGMELEMGEVTLGMEDSFLVYTDGLDEAVDSQDNPYGLGRAERWLSAATVAPAPEMLQGLIADWRGFTGEVDQFDDLTLLLFRRRR